jgi:hypothetical protein
MMRRCARSFHNRVRRLRLVCEASGVSSTKIFKSKGAKRTSRFDFASGSSFCLPSLIFSRFLPYPSS